MNLKMLLFASVSLVLFASCHNSDDPYMTLATKTLDVEAEGGPVSYTHLRAHET